MEIKYETNVIPTAQQVIDLYEDASLPRPTKDEERIKLMFANSNLVVTAWHEEKLVGVARSITDWVWSCYLADLAIHSSYQKLGIGKQLVQLTQDKVGDQTMVILLSVPTAFSYYPKIGFDKEDRAFSISRKR